MAPQHEQGWSLAFGATFLAIAVLRLSALDSGSPGLHKDEAAFGYNAWTIAHYGLDQDGRPWPLFFTAFADYRSPVYVYLLAPLTWGLPLTSAVERLPAAFAGILLCALVAVLAFSLTRSYLVALLSTLMAAIQPWVVIESRSGWAPILEILGLTAVCYCLSRAMRCDKHGSSTEQAWRSLSVFCLRHGPAVRWRCRCPNTGRVLDGAPCAGRPKRTDRDQRACRTRKADQSDHRAGQHLETLVSPVASRSTGPPQASLCAGECRPKPPSVSSGAGADLGRRSSAGPNTPAGAVPGVVGRSASEG